ncbi:hypothetical protein PG994_006403 [Apiospora phragmitis]|uniref:Prion-inhibition and propagation HeLo domain-containing protein n=1 Tax=Apiospora phragmitis TaxID=2905665 RepID=A0ABR1VFX3_9PEZI
MEVAGLAIRAIALVSLFKDTLDVFSYISAANHDRRLDDPVTHRVISRILGNIRILLSKGSDLQQRYGVDKVDNSQSLVISVPAISNVRMQEFLRQFESLKIGTGKRQKETSVAKRFFWVVRNKEKFEALIRQLSGLVSKLNAVIPPGEISCAQ